MKNFETARRSFAADTAEPIHDGSASWDWHTFSGDLTDMTDHASTCDICGHNFHAAGARRAAANSGAAAARR